MALKYKEIIQSSETGQVSITLYCFGKEYSDFQESTFCSVYTFCSPDTCTLNLSLSSFRSNSGIDSVNSVRNLLLSPSNNLHLKIKCSSSSTSFLHTSHVLFSLGIFGLKCLPFSSLVSLGLHRGTFCFPREKVFN